MATKTRRWCKQGAHMAPHIGAVCLTCQPEPAPAVEVALAEPLALEFAAPVVEYVLPEPPSALDVIRAAGARGATVGEIIAAGADPAELVADVTGLEMAGRVETRYHGPGTGVRDGRTVFFAVERKETA